MKQVAVINCGSSSVKFQVLDVDSRDVLVDGLVEGIGEETGHLALRFPQIADDPGIEISAPIIDHQSGLDLLIRQFSDAPAVAGKLDLTCIGHRVVHGGEAFTEPALITDDVLAAIREQIPLAPLHNPANIVGIEAAMAAAPDLPQVAVFDTAFHQSMPEHAYLYALPRRLYDDHKVRRYGFHGTSHSYVARAAAEYLSIPLESFNGIVLHLGNGASVTAVRGGQSVETSMGLTPLEGLVMGTRSGDIDPALPAFLAANAGMSIGEIDTMLNRESGLKGICGDNDMRAIVTRMDAGDTAARTAFDMFCHRARKYLGAYMAVLGRVDAVIFTAGIGENAPRVREAICGGLEPLGIEIDAARNAGRGGPKRIQSDASRIEVLVIPTEEELEIALQASLCVERAGA